VSEATIDLSGLECPVPSIRTKRKLLSMAIGERLTVICTDPMAAVDIPFLVHQLGHELRDHQERDGKLIFDIAVKQGNKGEDTWPMLQPE
jgi:tRNA 2-thiouridine synthesizing protein A